MFLRYCIKVIVASVRGFLSDGCSYKASALTFYTLLSLVPILAIAFGIANQLGLEEYVERQLSTSLLDQPEVANQLGLFAQSVLKNVHGGWIALVGTLGLLWTSLQLFSSIELSLNDIWKANKQRPFLRQVRDYFWMLIFGPIFFVLSSSLSFLATSFISHLTLPGFLGHVSSPIFHTFIHPFPLMINWILFTFIYALLPNVHVPWKVAFSAAVVAGTIYQFVQTLYIYFQIGVASYGAIYGSFAALPLFLVWINTSWSVVLFGAEIAYAIDMIPYRYRESSQVSKRQLAIGILGFFCEANEKKWPPLKNRYLSRKLGIPLNAVRRTTTDLCDAGWIKDHPSGGFFLTHSLDSMKLADVLFSLDDEEKFLIQNNETFIHFNHFLKTFDVESQKNPSNLSFKEIVRKSKD